MYRFLDKPLNDCTASEKFIVWAIRGWIAAIKTKKCPRHYLKSGFSRNNGEHLFQTLATFMGVLHSAHKRPVHFCSLPCARISDDEALLLAAFAALEAGKAEPARAVFNDMLAPTGARQAMTMGIRLMEALREAGYSLNVNRQSNDR